MAGYHPPTPLEPTVSDESKEKRRHEEHHPHHHNPHKHDHSPPVEGSGWPHPAWFYVLGAILILGVVLTWTLAFAD